MKMAEKQEQPFEDWERVKADTGLQLVPGGYAVQVVEARFDTSRAGNRQIVLALDICRGKYLGYYNRLFQAKKARYGSAKWGCVYYCRLRDNDGATNGRFKGLVELFERNNSDFKFDPMAPQAGAFKGFVVGGVFRNEEWLNENGEMRVSIKCDELRDVAGIESVPIPPVKKMSAGGFSVPVDDWYPPDEF